MSILRKSQAALEFLTTYAWAFLVLLILIGALGYFGILSPSKFLPERCSFGSEIGCTDYVIASNGVQLRLRNNAGNPIIVDAVTVSNEKAQLSCISPQLSIMYGLQETSKMSLLSVILQAQELCRAIRKNWT